MTVWQDQGTEQLSVKESKNMAFEIKNEKGETTKVGGKMTETDQGSELTDWAEYPPMPEAPSEKYR